MLGPWEIIGVGVRQIGCDPTPALSRPWGEIVEGTGTLVNDPLRFLRPLGFLKAFMCCWETRGGIICANSLKKSKKIRTRWPLIFAIQVEKTNLSASSELAHKVWLAMPFEPRTWYKERVNHLALSNADALFKLRLRECRG